MPARDSPPPGQDQPLRWILEEYATAVCVGKKQACSGPAGRSAATPLKDDLNGASEDSADGDSDQCGFHFPSLSLSGAPVAPSPGAAMTVGPLSGHEKGCTRATLVVGSFSICR
jgi:hypothetical protein